MLPSRESYMRTAITLLVFSFGFCIPAHAADRPNVLLICVDDLKPLLGCYGDELAHTPNIDQLAARGLRLDAAYCNQAVCSPSRNALLTSLRSTTLGIYDLGTNFRKAAPNAVTLPQHFKQHGYRSEGMGKIFHVGHGNHEDAASWSLPHWGTHVVQYVLPENRPPQGKTREEALFSNVPGKQASKLPRGAAFESADVPDDAYSDGRLADRAVERLKFAAEHPDEPFFMAVGFVKPHLPFCAPKKYWDLYDPGKLQLAERRTSPEGAPGFATTSWLELRNYSNIPNKGPLPDDLQRTLIHGYRAATSYMDAQVGRVLKALDDTGLAKNTIIVFWGDHGWHLGDHGMWCKHTNYEQAARIPLIVFVPGAGSAGTSASELVESVDIYPTLCKLADLPAPDDLDGTSFDALLSDQSAKTKPAIFHSFPRGERIGRAVRTDRYRLVEWKKPGEPADTATLELYDYENDPGETKNFAADLPEVVAELRAMLNQQPEAKPQLKVAAKKVAKPENIVTREQWGSDADPIPDSRKHTPRWVTLHHAGVLWTNTVEPARFIRNMQFWGKRRPEIEQPPRNTYWPDLARTYRATSQGCARPQKLRRKLQ
jgi:iduronate 2-sulfatase